MSGDERTLTPSEARLTAPTGARQAPPPLRATGYALGSVIGRGGMGEVLLATDQRIGREVAIKRMLTADPTDDALARFLREAKIQARLDHPAIVPVHELGEDDEGRPYFTMKRLSGRTLHDKLADPAQPPQPLLRAFVDVCLAIALAHARGIVHRDLKPANIMLGDYGEVYVLDWGIARVLGEADDAFALAADTGAGETQVGAILGTPAYMPPQQARGEQVGPPADVYSLGAILFEILAREPLRPRSYRVGEEPEVPDGSPVRRRPDRAIAPELDAACLAALAADPAARPGARELGERVQRYLDGDRDLEHRRALAAEHLAAARAARDREDRATAMQEAGRALALDAASDAAALIGSLLVEPPRVMPDELVRELADEDRRYARNQWRTVSVGYFAFLTFLPVAFWQGVTDWAVIAATFAIAGGLGIHALIASRSGSRLGWTPLLLSGTMVMLTTRIFGVFILAPALVCMMCSSWYSYPGLMHAPKRIYAFVLTCGTLPLVLEALGAIAPSWSVHDGVIASISHAVHLGGTGATVLLVGGQIGAISIAALFGRSLAFSRRQALRQVEIQAWHLRQLVRR
ncbi:MAG: serine/threonine-protein kinase [Acidobacteriota bacterium]